jgi:hypothetical protein
MNHLLNLNTIIAVILRYLIDLSKRGFLYLFLFSQVLVYSQARKRSFVQDELGFFGGGSYYIGDINTRTHFLYSKPAGGIYWRHTNHYRYAFRIGVNYGQIFGDDALSKDANQTERNLSFKSNVYEFSSLAEFNFVDYRIGNEHENFTFFIFAGLAGYYFNPKADIGNGDEPLRAYNTEGQSQSYKRVQLSIPYGIGIKFNAGEKLGIGIEWGPRKTYTDYLDDVSGTYPGSVVPTDNKNNFTNRTTNASASPGSMRGNPTTKDWYFFYGISLNYKLPSKRGSVCHGSGKQFRMKKDFFKQFHLRNRSSIFK